MDDLTSLLDDGSPQRPQPPTPEAAPPTQSEEQRKRSHAFKSMSASQEEEYGERWAVRYKPDGTIYPFDKHAANNKNCEIVPRALLDEQGAREAALDARLEHERHEAEVEARMNELRYESDIDKEARKRLAAERKRAPAPPAPEGQGELVGQQGGEG